MATVSVWSGVGVAMQSALATAVTITGITKASPGVVTYTGTDPTTGDYVLLAVTGMSQLNNRVVRIASVDSGANTFQLEGVDTSAYDTFATGTAQVITFGTTLATATGLSASGGDPQFIDTTTIHDTVQTQIPGVLNAASYSMENIWDPADAGLIAAKTASDAKLQRAFKFAFANGAKVVFVGYVSCSLLPVGQAQQKVTTPMTITMYGRAQSYSS